MATKAVKSRFENEVRFGLLAIVFLLVLLNFVSNFIVFRARSVEWEAASARFQSTAFAASRMLTNSLPVSLDMKARQELQRTYSLNSIDLVPTGPDDLSRESRRRWFGSIAGRVPAIELPGLAEKLIGAEFERLARGKGDEYFYVHPVKAGGGTMVMILSRDLPELAYLDDSYQIVAIISVLSVLAIGVVYLLLSRMIFAPFRKIRERAQRAGRSVDVEHDGAEAVVEEYRRIIDELQEKERELRRLNAKIQRRADSLEQFNNYLLESVHSGIITVDAAGTILSFNDAACRMLGVDMEECVGRSYVEVLAPDCSLGTALRRLLADGESCEYGEASYAVPDGRQLALGMSTARIHDPDGAAIGGAILLHDLTELNRLRHELETRNRLAALGEMAGGLAHQLRNSIGAIGGYLTLLGKRLAKQGIRERSVDELVNETSEAESLIERFLQFARPLQPDCERISLEVLLADVRESFEIRQDFSNITVDVCGEPSVDLDADVLLLKQVLSNLVDNAADAYRGESGIVRVVGRAVDEDTLRITVHDSGCGIASENIPKIFTPFFSSRPSGNGLGLPLAEKIVAMHGGRLAVTSEPGEGTTFTVELPRRQTAGAAVPVEASN